MIAESGFIGVNVERSGVGPRATGGFGTSLLHLSVRHCTQAAQERSL